ncbi:MAG: membrane-bound lytic murein transglycosylase MltF [Desulfobacterales bacterium]|nr:membrane-bound lytic murein transglycosylase MltF [Desulfobacterales bacterium]
MNFIKQAMKVERAPFLVLKKFFFFLLIGPLFLGACGKDNTALDRIMESGTITIITRNDAHCYYTYRGQEMGFEYDLAKAFADFLGVKLKVKVPESRDQLLPLLDKGAGEVVAASITTTPSGLELADFSKRYISVQQMVITHKKDTNIRSMNDLVGKNIHVCRGTPYEARLRTIEKMDPGVIITARDDVSTEDLIRGVAEGKIEITVADSNVALLNRRYYPDIRIAFPIKKPQPLCWAVKKGGKALLNEINEFFDTIEEDGTFLDIYNRYYAYVERFDHLDIKRFQHRMETRFPKYMKTIKEAAKLYRFDWRLIAALIYQESQFNPWAKSFSGVRGLMQLTLPTAMEMGVKNRLNPQESIMGGVRYLKMLYDVYDNATEPDRTLIAFAAYNVGKGHVIDARTLASKMKLDPNKWSSLEKTLPLLSDPKYYKKSRFGYCRGREPVSHVQRILTYYNILKKEAIKYRTKGR